MNALRNKDNREIALSKLKLRYMPLLELLGAAITCFATNVKGYVFILDHMSIGGCQVKRRTSGNTK